MDVKELFEQQDKLMGKTVTLSGWVRNHRKQKEFGFIDFSDGTCFKHLQLVYKDSLKDFEEIQKFCPKLEQEQVQVEAQEQEREQEQRCCLLRK